MVPVIDLFAKKIEGVEVILGPGGVTGLQQFLILFMQVFHEREKGSRAGDISNVRISN